MSASTSAGRPDAAASGEAEAPEARGLGFGTAPVFLASLSTILGAIMFLRFGYAVAHVGALGALAIVVLGHMVTLPTALAIAEIATNRRVEGGGEYFIISRSFGPTIGASIGVSLYLSQAISVAFYLIAFAEAFRPLGGFVEAAGLAFDTRLVSLPTTVLLALLVLTRGASLGVKALWVVVAVLFLSLILFFLGAPVDGHELDKIGWLRTVDDPDPFILVFAIVFPAFTGMTAGVGLSGDLANPRRSIPLGILSATGVGMVVYVAQILKLSRSAPPDALAADPLIMSQIAVWGPVIPLGLACATLSSAIGSILVAPRTLQALAADRMLPWARVNDFLRSGHGAASEPRNATLVTAAFALATVAAGSVDFVARVISMFFMVTYGAICAISFLEHFAARPSYRPSFRSKWYVSLFGAVMCVLLMFQMDPLYAVLAIVVMIAIYQAIRATPEAPDDLGAIVRGVMTQLTRHMQITLQKTQGARRRSRDWRPSIIMVNGRTFERSAPLQFFSWLCHRYGFGTYLHLIQGGLDADTFRESRKLLPRIIAMTRQRDSAVYVDTMVSPSVRSALAQSLQFPGVSGMDNNTVLFEFSVHDEGEADEVAEGCRTAAVTRMNGLVLRHGDHYFGGRSEIHVWITWHDHRNASLMILLAYILLGHPDWQRAEIRIFAAYPHAEVKEQSRKLTEMISAGRLPIVPKNVRIVGTDDRIDFSRMVQARSASADLVILGFTETRLQEKGVELLLRHPALREVVFVMAQESILIE